MDQVWVCFWNVLLHPAKVCISAAPYVSSPYVCSTIILSGRVGHPSGLKSGPKRRDTTNALTDRSQSRNIVDRTIVDRSSSVGVGRCATPVVPHVHVTENKRSRRHCEGDVTLWPRQASSLVHACARCSSACLEVPRNLEMCRTRNLCWCRTCLS